MRIVNKIGIFLVLLIFFCCKEKREKDCHLKKKFQFDIIDDSNLETIYIENIKGISKISIFYNNKISTIMKIMPLINEEYKNTFPPIENIYLEANNIQTKDKGLRIKVRNTDLIPDYYYIDIYTKKDEWYILNIGVINTKDSSYIRNKKINNKLNNYLDKNNTLNLLEFINNENCK